MPADSQALARSSVTDTLLPWTGAPLLPRTASFHGSPSVRSSPSRQVWLVAIMLFLLVATNARPVWWSSAVPAALISLWLIGSRGPARVMQLALTRTNAPIFWCLLALTACTTISAAAMMEFQTLQTLLLRCVIPLLIYFSVVGMRLRAADIGVCVLAILAGSSIPLVSGLIAFFQQGGALDLADLLYARYDLVRMADYMNVTFGNVGHVGMFALLIAPPVFVAIAAGVLSRLRVAFCSIWLCVVVANMVISGSRTAFAVALAIIALLSLALYKGRTVTLCATVLGGCSLFLLSAELIDKSVLIERLAPSVRTLARDNSVSERLESIQIGWETFKANTQVGVGPGKSAEYNQYDVPHQSVLMVASETGVLGGLAFLCLNLVVLFRTGRHAWRAKRSDLDRRRLLWIAGPSSWLLGGALAGITFNMSVALLWVGTFYAMLGLYGFQDISPPRVASGVAPRE